MQQCAGNLPKLLQRGGRSQAGLIVTFLFRSKAFRPPSRGHGHGIVTKEWVLDAWPASTNQSTSSNGHQTVRSSKKHTTHTRTPPPTKEGTLTCMQTRLHAHTTVDHTKCNSSSRSAQTQQHTFTLHTHTHTHTRRRVCPLLWCVCVRVWVVCSLLDLTV